MKIRCCDFFAQLRKFRKNFHKILKAFSVSPSFMGNKSSSAGVDTADVNNNASPSHMGNKSAGNDDTFFSNNEAPPVPPRSKLQPPRRPSYMSQAKAGYRELCNAIVRPPRCEYTIEHLGPSAFKFCGKMFTRTDFQLDTIRGPTLQCSHWEPVERTQDRIPGELYYARPCFNFERYAAVH